MAWIVDYSFRGAPSGTIVAEWPADIPMRLAADRPTLVMAAHPQCPCTRASLEELAVIRAQAGPQLHIVVLFAELEGVETHSDTWRQALSIPDAVVSADSNGAMTARLGATSSGQTFVFDPNGQLLFSGGITSSRGHAGANVGRSAVLAIARGGGAQQAGPTAFGCALRGHPGKARS